MKRYLVQANVDGHIGRQIVIADNLVELDKELPKNMHFDLLAIEIIGCYHCKKELTWRDYSNEEVKSRQVCLACKYNGY